MIKIDDDEEFLDELSEDEKIDVLFDNEEIDAVEAGFLKGYLEEED
ncbi:hypothetical protein HYT56_00980 [Candidatus Woesearchaeota archaeon]|nr:hypothetical protein [Candidatus Woesearchaeota archaeon]